MCIHENTKTPEFQALVNRLNRIGFIEITTGTPYPHREHTVFCQPELRFIENAVADLRRWHPNAYLSQQTTDRIAPFVGWDKADEMYHKDYTCFRNEADFPSVDFGNLPFEEMVQKFRDYGYAAQIKSEAPIQEVAPGRPPGPLTPEEILAMSNELENLKGQFHDQLNQLYNRVGALEENVRLEAEAEQLTQRANAILEEIPNVLGFLGNLPEEELPEDNYRKILQEELKKFGEAVGVQIGEHVRQQINNMRIQYDEGFGYSIRREISSAVHNELDSRMQAVASVIDLIQGRARKIDKRLKRLEKGRAK